MVKIGKPVCCALEAACTVEGIDYGLVCYCMLHSRVVNLGLTLILAVFEIDEHLLR